MDAYNAMGPWVDIDGDFTIQPNQQDCVFSADVDGGYGTISYKWYKSGTQVSTTSQLITTTGSSGSFELKLTVTDGQSVSKTRTRWVSIHSSGVECFW